MTTSKKMEDDLKKNEWKMTSKKKNGRRPQKNNKRRPNKINKNHPKST